MEEIILKELFRFLFVLLGLSFVFPENVYAYLDPGTTSYIIQSIIGFILVVGASIGVFWNKIKQIFRRNIPTDAKDQLDEEEN